MYMISDSDDDSQGRYKQKSIKLNRNKKLHCSEPVESIDLCDVSSVLSNDTSVTVKSAMALDGKNYDSSNLFLSDPITEVEHTTQSRAKRKSVKSPAARGRGTSKRIRGGRVGRGKSRGKGRNHVINYMPELRLTPSPPPTCNGRSDDQASVISDDVVIINTPEPSDTAKRTKRQARKGKTPSAPNNRRGHTRDGSRRRSPRQSIPTFNIGNCDEYPDASGSQELFSHNKQETNDPDRHQEIINDLDNSLNNEELSVKVYWQNLEVVKFSIRRLQKMTEIFDFFMKRENVNKEQLFFTYNNHILQSNDTPDSIDYSIAKFIEGGIVNTNVTCLTNTQGTKAAASGFILKFQCQSMKRPIAISINETDKLQIGLIKCAEHLELPLSQLKFEFDGEIVTGKATPGEMDIVSGDCIDVKILNK